MCLLTRFGFAQAQLTVYSDTVCSFGNGATNTVAISNPPRAGSDVDLRVWARGDLNSSNEYIDVYSENGGYIGRVGGLPQCGAYGYASFVVPMDSFNVWLADGTLTFDGVFSLSTGFCSPSECMFVEAIYNAPNAPNDAGVEALIPNSAICPGSYQVSVGIKNYGINQISSVQVHWEVNGMAQPVVSYTGLLDTAGGLGSQTDTVLLGMNTYQSGQNYNLKAWTSLPNGMNDTLNTNDTLVDMLTLLTMPQGLVVSHVLATSARVSWNTTPGTSYDLIYGPNGFNPSSSGTILPNVSSPYNLTGLSPSTSYDVYVRANCGSGAFNSWAGPSSFQTACGMLVAPIVENFDNTMEWYASGSNFGNTIGSCWTANPNMSNSTPFKWIPRSTGPTSGNGPYQDVTGGNFMYCEASGSGTGNVAELITPLVDVSGLNTPALYFMQHRFNTNTVPPAPMDIEVSNDGGTTWSNVYSVSGNIQSSAADAWSFEFVNLAAYTGDTILIKFIQTSLGCCGDAAIDSLRVDEAPLCPWPTDLYATGVTSSSVDLHWSDPSGNTWDVEYGPCGFALGTGTLVSTTTRPFILAGLLPDTCYEVYLRNNCTATGDSTSLWIGPVNFTTACAAFTAPFFDNFDANPSYIIPNCWKSIIEAQSTPAPFIETTSFNSPFSAPVHTLVYNGTANIANGDRVILVSPEFSDFPDGDKSIKFSAYATSGSSASIIVGSLNQVDSTGIFSPIDTVFLGTSGHAEYLIPVDLAAGYNGSDHYIGLMHGSSSLFQSILIDDFYYGDCFAPDLSSLGISNIGINQATATWGTGTQTTATLIEWGLPGFSPGMGTSLGTAVVPGTLNQYTISGLSPQTTYEYYVADSCSSGGLSTFAGPYSFTTLCGIVSAPFIEDFDGVQWSGTGNTAGNQISPCWSSAPDVSQNTVAFKWIPYNFGPSSGNGPYSDVTGGNYMYCEASGSLVGDSAFFTSPAIDISGLTLPSLYFWQHRYYTAVSPPADMDVQVSNDYGVNWSTVYSISGNTQNSPSDPWQEVFVDLGQFLGDTIQLRFVQISKGCCGDAAIDSVTVVNGPTCPDPTNLVVSSVLDTAASISWSNSIHTQSTELWIGPQGFYQGPQTTGGTKIPLGAGSNVLIDSLMANTCYEVLIRSLCGPNDSSNWVGPVSFCTACQLVQAPYFEDFSNNTVGHWFGEDNCWQFQSNNPSTTSSGGYSWEVRNTMQGTSSGTGPDRDNTLYPAFGGEFVTADVSGSNGNLPDSSLLISPLVDISGLTNPEVQYYFHRYGFRMADLYVDVFDGTSWVRNVHAFTNWTGEQTSSSADWQDTTIDLSAYAGTTNLQIRFRTVSNGCCDGDNAIDDVHFRNTPSCLGLGGLTTEGIVDTAATLSWSSASQALSHEIWIGPAGFYQGAQTIGGTKYVVASPIDSLVVGSLASNTCYDWLVRGICGPGDTSNWVGPVSFCTTCQIIQAPYFEGFSGSSVGHWDGEDNCWQFQSNNPSTTASGGYSWEVRNSVQVTSVGTGPDRDNTLYPAFGGTFITADVSQSGTTDSSLLISPLVDLSNLTNPEVSYHYHRYGLSMAELYVDVYDGTQWHRGVHAYTSLTGSQLASSDPWNDTIIDLSPYASSNIVQIRFRSKSNGCCDGDNAIDDVHFREAPTCPEPSGLNSSNLTAFSTDLNWTPGTSGNLDFEISYGIGLTMSNVDQGTKLVVNANMHTLTSLNPASAYCAFVREICGSGDTSLWIGPVCFTTPCSPLVIAPYTTGFDNLTTGLHTLPWENCWSANTIAGPYWQAQTSTGLNQGTPGTGPIYDADSPGTPGGTFMVLETSTNSGQHELFSPYIDIAGLSDPELEYYYHMFGADMGTLEVYAEDLTGTRTFLDSLVGQKMTSGNAAFNVRNISLNALSASVFRLVFKGIHSSGNQGDMAIDKIKVHDLGGTGGPCALPTNLSAQFIGCDSITLQWSSNSGSSIITYGNHSFIPGTGTSTGIVSSPYTIHGLSYGTVYDFYVADVCANDTSLDFGPVSLSTIGTTLNAAFVHNFGTPASSSRRVFFDASNSSGASAYNWDFGDGNTGVGLTVFNDYTANGAYPVELVVSNNCGSDTIVDTVNVREIGAPEPESISMLSIYPNPARDLVKISGSAATADLAIKICDISGKQLISRNLRSSEGQFELVLDVSHLSKGVYFMIVDDGNYHVKRKLVLH